MFAASKTKGVSAVAANYIEDVFSTWLYTGNGSTQTITNGIDLAGKGGLVWLKDRTQANPAWIMDTVRGTASTLQPSSTSAAGSISNAITAFNANGFSIGANGNSNTSGNNLVSWTFRKQPKFFDVVTYTGTGSVQTIAHNLGSVPGCIIVKRLNAASTWRVYHRSLTSADYVLSLNLTAGEGSVPTAWNGTAPTSTVFTVGTSTDTNASGGTYVAYLFAHNAGGFGLTGTDNVISCGSFTTNGSGNATVNLGYEPQWVLWKPSSTADAWVITDNMRGLTVGGNDQLLYPNLSNAEASGDVMDINALGFSVKNQQLSSTYIYIAIRRGPMKVPTDGTKVFAPFAYTGSGNINARNYLNGGFAPDTQLGSPRNDTGTSNFYFADKLRGPLQFLQTASTASEGTSAGNLYYDNNGATAFVAAALADITYLFKRAPSFFDEVCYTGVGTGNVQHQHNLGVPPELIIIKSRSSATYGWPVYAAPVGNTSALYLNTTATPRASIGYWNNTTPTASVFTTNWENDVETTGATYVAYLFATCPGVSKVGSYTGNGTTQTINCSFTGGARFVLIKRTDSTGDWYVYDTARGMTVLTDPYLRLNSTAAESATLGSVITTSVGFIVDASVLAAINTNGASYIYLAIA